MQMLSLILIATVSLDLLMTPHDKKETGYNALSKEEQIALEHWIKDRFIQKNQGKDSVVYLRMNLKEGKELLLENDSRWAINPLDQKICSLWILSYPLKIVQNNEGEYPYTLTNLYTQKSVRAKKIQ